MDEKTTLMSNVSSTSGEPLVFIPDGARINFGPNLENPPTTKYNNWRFVMDDETKRKITGKPYGTNG